MHHRIPTSEFLHLLTLDLALFSEVCSLRSIELWDAGRDRRGSTKILVWMLRRPLSLNKLSLWSLEWTLQPGFAGERVTKSEVMVSHIRTLQVTEMELMCPAAFYWLPH